MGDATPLGLVVFLGRPRVGLRFAWRSRAPLERLDLQSRHTQGLRFASSLGLVLGARWAGRGGGVRGDEGGAALSRLESGSGGDFPHHGGHGWKAMASVRVN